MPYQAARLRLTRRPMVTSEAKDVGDCLTQTATANTLSAVASNGYAYAVYMDAARLSSSTDVTTQYTVMLCTPENLWYFPVEAGTFTAADINTDADFNSADGIAIDTSSNDDFHVDLFITSTIGVGRFNNVFPRTL